MILLLILKVFQKVLWHSECCTKITGLECRLGNDNIVSFFRSDRASGLPIRKVKKSAAFFRMLPFR